MSDAFNYYKSESGQLQQEHLQEKKAAVNDVVNAINKRDDGVVQLDEAKMTTETDGGAMTAEDALEHISTMDMTVVMQKAMQGDLADFNKANAALVRVGGEPLTLDRDYTTE